MLGTRKGVLLCRMMKLFVVLDEAILSARHGFVKARIYRWS